MKLEVKRHARSNWKKLPCKGEASTPSYMYKVKLYAIDNCCKFSLQKTRQVYKN